jgi:hypothetical protein
VTVYVFLGPSLPVDDARKVLDAVYLPPVRLGDVWRAGAFGDASAIGIVDGYFERVPDVWHKEILWALTNGITVAGAASMGALRAAELGAFGMIGIGRIFEAYASGAFPPYAEEVFEDDDEVAVVHGPVDSSYVASEAMVNIRATLAAAADAGAIAPETRNVLARLAKRLFYKERSWATLLRLAASAAAGNGADTPNSGEIEALRAWLPTGRVDQKRLDALALLRWLAENRGHVPDARFRFADTSVWRRAIAPTPDPADARVLMELRLQGAGWREERDAALVELIGGGLGTELPRSAPRCGDDADAALQNLNERAAREGKRHDLVARASPLLDAAMLARLRRNGLYDRLLTRAVEKERHLRGIRTVSVEPPPPERLVAWFAARIGGGAPTNALTLAGWLDIDDVTLLLDAVAAEYRFAGSDSQ